MKKSMLVALYRELYVTCLRFEEQKNQKVYQQYITIQWNFKWPFLYNFDTLVYYWDILVEYSLFDRLQNGIQYTEEGANEALSKNRLYMVNTCRFSFF